MCAGLASLQQLRDGAIYQRLEQLGARLERALLGVPHLALQRAGSIFWLCASRAGQPRPPMRALSAFPADAARSYAGLFHALLEQGIYLAPSGFEVGFLSAAHTESHVDALAASVRAHLNAVT